jgi:hypothetical protein
MNKERVFQSDALTSSWRGIGPDKAWWFDTSTNYGKQYSLDGQGIPICWDDEGQIFPVEETRDCTGGDTCTVILSKAKKRVMIVLNKNLDHVIIQGSVEKKITWKDYNRQGLWAAKQHCTDYGLMAVVINPMIKTLEKFKVLKTTIKKVIAARDLMKGEDNEPAEKADTADQGEPAGK